MGGILRVLCSPRKSTDSAVGFSSLQKEYTFYSLPASFQPQAFVRPDTEELIALFDVEFYAIDQGHGFIGTKYERVDEIESNSFANRSGFIPSICKAAGMVRPPVAQVTGEGKLSAGRSPHFWIYLYTV